MSALGLNEECNSYAREIMNEGNYKCKYSDSLGLPTIGVGFNLKRSGARSDIESVGADYLKVLSGAKCLTDWQIRQLFNADMQFAVDCANRFVSRIGDIPLSAVADMAFNMGCRKLQQFTTFRSLLQERRFHEAARDLRGTKWCRQVGYRCNRNVACVEKGMYQRLYN